MNENKDANANCNTEESAQAKAYGQLTERSGFDVDNRGGGWSEKGSYSVSALRRSSHTHPLRGEGQVEVASHCEPLDAPRAQEIPVSTRQTIAHCDGPVNMHVYKEFTDNENVYIELRQDFSVSYFKLPLGVAFAVARKLMPAIEEAERVGAMSDEDIIAQRNCGMTRNMHEAFQSRNACRQVIELMDKVMHGLV